MRGKSAAIVTFALFVALSVVLGGWSSDVVGASSGAAAEPQRGGVFRLAFPTDIPTMDPAHAGYDLESWSAVVAAYNGLVNYDKGVNLVPELAESYTQSKDGKTFTFKLRKGVKFHNGREMTADDVKYSLERIVDPATKSEGAWLFEEIVKGAKEFQAGKASHVSGIKVVDRYTVEIQLNAPQAFFLYKLAMPYAYIVPKEEVEKYGEEFGRHPVGTGAFKLKEWKAGQSVTLVRNEDYFKPGLPYLDEVRYIIGPDDNKKIMMFERGELEITDIPAADFVRLTTSKKWQPYVVKTVDVATYFLGMKNNRKPFDDVRVRQALNYAVDKEKIIKLLNGRGVVANGVLPPAMPGFNSELKGYDYTPDKAKKLLAEAGLANGFSTEIWSWNDDQSVRVVQSIIADLAKVGIKAESRPVSMATFAASYAKEDQAPMFLFVWINDYPDPQDFLYNLFSKETWGSNKSVYYFNKDVEGLLQKAQVETDREARFKMYQEAEKQIVKDAPWVFLYHPITYNLHQPNVHDYYLHPIHLWRFEDYWMSGTK